MNASTQVLAEIHDQRLKRNAEAARWAQYRREANPPAWFVIISLAVVLGGMLWFAGSILKHPGVLRSPFGYLIVPCALLIMVAGWIARRRERTLLRIVQDEAPALYQKLKEESFVR